MKESLEALKKGFDKLYNKTLAKRKCLIPVSNIYDFVGYVNGLAPKSFLTLCKPPISYSIDLAESIQDRIACYTFNMQANSYHFICQMSKTFNILFSFGLLVEGGTKVGLIPYFSFENPEDYLKFVEENNKYETEIYGERRAGFGFGE